MKVVQFFKIYNFHVMKIFTRSKDLKIFSKIQKNFIPLRKNTFDCKIIIFFWAKIHYSCQNNDYQHICTKAQNKVEITS